MWNRQHEETSAEQPVSRLPGVVDTIGLGYETLALRPHLILPPVVLDLYLWLGVNVTSRPLLLKLGDWLRGDPVGADGLASTIESRGVANVQEVIVLWLPTVRVPTFISALSAETSYRLEGWRPAVVLPWWGVLATALILLILALVIGAEYFMAMAAVTTSREPSPLKRPFRKTLRGSVRLAGWFAAVVTLASFIVWPVVGAGLLLSYLGAGVSGWLYFSLLFPLSWGFMFFFFSVQAMFVDQIGPIAALRSSYLVVRSDFWQAFGLVIAYFLVVWGFPQVWRVFITQPLGLIIAIIGHAAICTGMIAATMVFYRDRSRYLALADRFQEG